MPAWSAVDWWATGGVSLALAVCRCDGAGQRWAIPSDQRDSPRGGPGSRTRRRHVGRGACRGCAWGSFFWGSAKGATWHSETAPRATWPYFYELGDVSLSTLARAGPQQGCRRPARALAVALVVCILVLSRQQNAQRRGTCPGRTSASEHSKAEHGVHVLHGLKKGHVNRGREKQQSGWSGLSDGFPDRAGRSLSGCA